MIKDKLIIFIKKYFFILSLFFYSVSFLSYYILSEYKRIALLFLIIASLCIFTLAIFERNNILIFLKKKKSQRGINSIFSFLMFFLIIVAVNFIFSKNDLKKDFTRNKIHTLSEQTVNILKNLKDEIKIIAFIPSIQTDVFKDAINNYQYYTNKLSYEIVDPNKDPFKAKTFDISSNNTFVVVSGTNVVKFYDDLSEENISNSIIKVLRQDLKKIYFLANHVEKSIKDEGKDGYSSIKKKIEGQNYQVEELNLLEAGKIPDDASLLIIAGPSKDFFEEEKKILLEYINKGKAALLMLDPLIENGNIEKNKVLNFITDNYNVSFAGDLIVDPNPALFGATPTMPVVKEYNTSHKITENFNMGSFFPNSQSLIIKKSDSDKIKTTELCTTSSKSWGEYNIRAGSVSFDSLEDREGPLSICAIFEADHEDLKLNLVLIGDSDFISNQYLNFVGNADLFLNMLSYLLKDEDLLSIRPKTQDLATFSINPIYMSLIAISTMFLIPFVVLSFGLVFWFRRRKQ